MVEDGTFVKGKTSDELSMLSARRAPCSFKLTPRSWLVQHAEMSAVPLPSPLIYGPSISITVSRTVKCGIPDSGVGSPVLCS